jgi:phenylpropionate dioxygenase-like ring-hydroxylating dioxygenase large terminal subunit
MFAKNVWYVAAFSHEIETAPFARKILGRGVVLYRSDDRQVHALEDRCCHRGMPLSRGNMVGDLLQCSYHGLCYDSTGVCVKIPGQDRIPQAAKVQAFVVQEQDGVIWIWMGNAQQADRSKIPRFPLHEDENWLWRGEVVHYRSNHMLVYDNLLDLTHVGYVHTKTIGGNGATHSEAEVEVEHTGDGLTVTRWMKNSVPPPTYLSVVPFPGRVDRWQSTQFIPGVIVISVGAREAGSAVGEHPEYLAHSFQAITPETEESTHYFWTTGVDARRFDMDTLEVKVAQVRQTFDEDREVIEAQFIRRQEDPDRALLDIKSDGPSLIARRIFNQLVRKESEPEANAVTR